MFIVPQVPDIDEIAEHYQDSRTALRLYFGSPAIDPVRFSGLSQVEIDALLLRRLAELDHSQSMTVLAAIEAMFRIDFDRRRRARRRDPLSRDFRALHKARGARVRLDEDILAAWYGDGPLAPSLISEIRGAMNLRHWLAHGRHWTAKLGRRYGFDELIALADALKSSDLLMLD